VSAIEVDRPGNKLRVTIRTSRPGIIIGRKGAEIEKLKQDMARKTKREVFIDIQEVHKPELDAQLVSENIAMQLEKRVAFRRAMRKAVDSALRFGCKGIKVRVSGRLNGAEIARSEWYLQGQLPLHTLRADIDYGFREARTTSGRVGVKVWIYKGDILPYKVSIEDKITREAAMAVGETSGQSGPRRLITAGGGRRRAETFATDAETDAETETEVETEVEAPAAVNGARDEAPPETHEETDSDQPVVDLLPQPTEPDDLERQLNQDEEMERQSRHEHHEAPHFRKESD